MREYETSADISADRVLAIHLPDYFRPGQIALKIRQAEGDDEPAGKVKPTKELLALVDRIRADVTTFRTKEEIDCYIEEECNSWDR